MTAPYAHMFTPTGRLRRAYEHDLELQAKAIARAIARAHGRPMTTSQHWALAMQLYSQTAINPVHQWLANYCAKRAGKTGKKA